METLACSSEEEIQAPDFLQESNADLLGHKWSYIGAFSGTLTATSAKYCAVLREKLKTAVHRKNSFVVVLMHRLVASDRKLKVCLPHSLYSSDLTPCDHHAFGPIKEVLRKCRFTSDDNVNEAVRIWIQEQQGDTRSASTYRRTMWITAVFICSHILMCMQETLL